MEGTIDWNAIPSWFVALNLIFAGFMWLVTRRTKIRMDSRIWGNTFIWVGSLYVLSYLDLNPPSLEERLIGSRLMICIIALSQWFPLLVSYVRTIYRNRKVDDGSGLERNSNHSNSDS